MRRLCPILLTAALDASAQGYTNWFIGNPVDAVTQPLGGVCLMGGATENDEAMRWFLQRAAGGDVLVLRASGSSGYQNYFYSELGVPVNSVETIRFDDASAAGSAYVHQRIQQAEAIWFAGGNQWNYVSYWRNTPIETLVNEAVAQRNVVIGGTSAGMAILGEVYFTAENGTVSSATALANPYAPAVALGYEPFLEVPFMAGVVTDTHYDNPDRRGRHMTFMARMVTDLGIDAKGIASEEYVAVCVDTNGIARVFGDHPNYQDFAWFLQVNCLYPEPPETCNPGQPLTWYHDGLAVKACKVPGDMEGTHTFDLNTWANTSGGTWEDWFVIGSILYTQAGGPAPDCVTPVPDVHAPAEGPRLVFDAVAGGHVLTGAAGLRALQCSDLLGRTVPLTLAPTADGVRFTLDHTAGGTYLLTAVWPQGTRTWKLLIP